jgi:hypothetical protein
MRDATRDPQGRRIELGPEPACCPGGACGPIFETPPLELAFKRMRDLVRDRSASAATPPLDEPPAPGTRTTPIQARKDAPHA